MRGLLGDFVDNGVLWVFILVVWMGWAILVTSDYYPEHRRRDRRLGVKPPVVRKTEDEGNPKRMG